MIRAVVVVADVALLWLLAVSWRALAGDVRARCAVILYACVLLANLLVVW